MTERNIRIVNVMNWAHELAPPFPGWASVRMFTEDGVEAHLFVPNYSHVSYSAEVGKFKIRGILKQ